MYVKFRANQMLFTIWWIILFFMHNFRLQKNLKIKHLIGVIAIDI